MSGHKKFNILKCGLLGHVERHFSKLVEKKVDGIWQQVAVTWTECTRCGQKL